MGELIPRTPEGQRILAYLRAAPGCEASLSELSQAAGYHFGRCFRKAEYDRERKSMYRNGVILDRKRHVEQLAVVIGAGRRRLTREQLEGWVGLGHLVRCDNGEIRYRLVGGLDA